MGKKRTYINEATGKEFQVDEENITVLSAKDVIMSGYFGKEGIYKYLKMHPEEIKDQKMFSELEEEFGEKDDNTEN